MDEKSAWMLYIAQLTIDQLRIELQDANRKLAALGHEPTKCLFGSIITPEQRSLSQQEWDELEEHEMRIHKDWHDTRKDAYNSGNP